MEWAWEALTSPHCIHGNLFFWIFSVPSQNKKVLFSFPFLPPKAPHKGPFSAHNGKKNKIKKIKKVFFFSKKIHFLCFFEFFILKSLPKISILGDFLPTKKNPYRLYRISPSRILFEKFFSIRVRETMLSK